MSDNVTFLSVALFRDPHLLAAGGLLLCSWFVLSYVENSGKPEEVLRVVLHEL